MSDTDTGRVQDREELGRDALTFEDFTNSIVTVFVHRPDPLTHAMLGLAGETGEVVDSYKKALRFYSPEDIPDLLRDPIVDELGDVLWYIAKVARELGVPLSVIAQRNMIKLERRRRERERSE